MDIERTGNEFDSRSQGLEGIEDPSKLDSIPISDAERKLLLAREAEYDANPDDVFTWDEVVAHIKRERP